MSLGREEVPETVPMLENIKAIVSNTVMRTDTQFPAPTVRAWGRRTLSDVTHHGKESAFALGHTAIPPSVVEGRIVGREGSKGDEKKATDEQVQSCGQ